MEKQLKEFPGKILCFVLEKFSEFITIEFLPIIIHLLKVSFSNLEDSKKSSRCLLVKQVSKAHVSTVKIRK